MVWTPAGNITPSNVVRSALAAAHKQTISPLASPPVAPSVGDLWVIPDAAAVGSLTSLPGALIDSSERSSSFDVQAIGTTYTEVEGLSLTIPPQIRPWYVTGMFTVSFVSGTAAIGSTHLVRIALTEYDSLGNVITQGMAYTAATYTTSKATTVSADAAASFHRPFSPTTTTRYFRVQARLAAAAVANWTSTSITAGDLPTAGQFYPPMAVLAVTL